jgi:integrase
MAVISLMRFNIRFHDLRHEATSRFFENTDLGVMEVKAITGHKTL